MPTIHCFIVVVSGSPKACFSCQGEALFLSLLFVNRMAQRTLPSSLKSILASRATVYWLDIRLQILWLLIPLLLLPQLLNLAVPLEVGILFTK